MKKFLILYRSSMPMSEMMAGTTTEQREAGMEAWMGWMKQAGDALVDPGAPIGAGHHVGQQERRDRLFDRAGGVRRGCGEAVRAASPLHDTRRNVDRSSRDDAD